MHLRSLTLKGFKSFASATTIPGLDKPSAVAIADIDTRKLTRILREQWGFEGFVVTDWAAVKELIAHGVAANEAEAAALEAAGAAMLLLECVPRELAARISVA